MDFVWYYFLEAIWSWCLLFAEDLNEFKSTGNIKSSPEPIYIDLVLVSDQCDIYMQVTPPDDIIDGHIAMKVLSMSSST